MDDAVKRYLARKVIGDIRSKSITNDLAEVLNSNEYISFLRSELQPSDLEILKNLAVDGLIYVSRLAINLLNRSCWQDGNKPEQQILDFLIDLRSNAKEYIRRHTAMMVLLEDEKIALEKREEFYIDLKDHWREFIELMHIYSGPSVLEFCESRLQDPAFPEWKKWTYLCGVTVGNDNLKAHQILNRNTDATDEFVRRVANDMKKICNWDHHSLA